VPEEPDHVEDISPTFDVKVEAVLRHRSQHGTSFGIEDDPTRFVAALRGYAEAAGGDAVALGEAFRRLTP
jgi:hypothetical protein